VVCDERSSRMSASTSGGLLAGLLAAAGASNREVRGAGGTVASGIASTSGADREGRCSSVASASYVMASSGALLEGIVVAEVTLTHAAGALDELAVLTVGTAAGHTVGVVGVRTETTASGEEILGEVATTGGNGHSRGDMVTAGGTWDATRVPAGAAVTEACAVVL